MKKFPNIEILERVGRGGMAEVFRAHLIGPGGFKKLIALKTVLPTLREERAFGEMFLDEARLLSKLSHPNIVSILRSGTDEETPYLALEWIDGISLKELAEQVYPGNDGLDSRFVIAVLIEICRALRFAHEFTDPETGQHQRIIHRDLSPHNVMIDRNGVTKLLDFGIAKILYDGQEITQSEFMKGKFPYFSPEMVLGQGLDERSDLFSLGIIGFELLTGERLFKADTDFETLERIRTKKIPPIEAVNPKLELALARIINRLLQRRPKQRYQTAHKLLKELLEVEKKFRMTAEEKASYAFPKVKPFENKTIVEKRAAPTHGSGVRTLLSTRYWVATAALILVVSVSLSHFLSVSKQADSNGPMRLIWKRSERQFTDLSAPPIEYSTISAHSSESLSISACHEVCLNLGSFALVLLDEKSAKKMEKRPNRVPANVFVERHSSIIKKNKAAFEKIFGAACGRLSYCKATEHLVLGYEEIATKNLKDIESYVSAHKVLVKSKSDHWASEKTRPFFQGDPFDWNLWGIDKRRSEGVKPYDTAPLIGADLVVLPARLFPTENMECKNFGDFMVARKLTKELTDDYTLKDTSLWVIPEGTSMAIEGYKGTDLYITLPDGSTDVIFEKGICQYKRESGRLVVARYWVPSSSMQSR